MTFHRRASDHTPFLYVADGGDQVLIEINLDSGAVRRIAGVVPPDNGGAPRKALCYDPAEEGGSPLAAHLRFPHKILFDSQERLVLADTDNNLVRLVTVYDPTPAIWTVAGIAQPDDDACGPWRRLPPFAFADGEARKVAVGSVQGMALDGAGNLILSDVQSNRVRKLWLSYLK